MILIVNAAKGFGAAETGDIVARYRAFAAETASFPQVMSGLLADRAVAEVLGEDRKRLDVTPSVFVQVVVGTTLIHNFCKFGTAFRGNKAHLGPIL